MFFGAFTSLVSWQSSPRFPAAAAGTAALTRRAS